ncbi:unnamed protein product [Mesocestoides corti]|uniref:tRNA (adenine(58)-N(1))-methyltransferase non-catalytic subunit TRM6 n=1 Tax=Mesocestoides corti TaxID=53468 RepID=A0A0R3U3S9_MESCO|nr:unnamed protein product [Mesocestoides corti]
MNISCSSLFRTMWKPIQIGDKVIVQKDDSYHVVEVQPNGFIVFEKVKVPISSIIGYPLGATFYFDGTKVTQVECDDIALEGIETQSSKDNRHLLDRSENQLLTADDIKDLKSAGSTGNVIISKLVEKSATFELKTKYSQEKYLKKKKKSYLFVFTVRPSNSRATAEMLSDSGRFKSTSLRYDSLVQLLTYANVHAGSTVLLTDSYGGLVSKAVMERLGHRKFGGRLINFFHGTSPPIVDMRPAEEYSRVYKIQFTEVSSLLLTGSFLRSHQAENGDGGTESLPPKQKCFLSAVDRVPSSDAAEPSPTELSKTEGPEPTRKQRKRPRNGEDMSGEDKVRLFQQKMEHLDEARRVLCPTDEELSLDLENRPDCLIVATRFYPVEVTLLLLQFLPPGRPFVVHSHLLPPLVDLYNILKRRGSCIQLALNDTWLRPIQVLPNRSHPMMRMVSGGGGFILRGYTVQRREDPDAFLRRSTMRTSTKQLFDEGLISYAQ